MDATEYFNSINTVIDNMPDEEFKETFGISKKLDKNNHMNYYLNKFEELLIEAVTQEDKETFLEFKKKILERLNENKFY